MQRALPCLLLAAACGGTESGDDQPGVDAAVATRGFEVISPDITIDPGQEITYCYYFRTPNTEDMVIKRWKSEMTPGSHHLIFYTTASDTMPPGTVSTNGCGGFGSGNLPSWTYAAQMPTAEVALPTDDGNGMPLGQDIKAGTAGYFQMHYLNTTDEPIQAHVKLTAEAYEVGTPYTKTAAFITYNSQISIDPGATGDIETQTCSTPAGSKFWMMSTHAHKQAVRTTVKDGATVVFNSTDWEHPGTTLWMASPYHSFATNKLTYECEYNNTGDNVGRTVTSGPSADTDEMCMGTGYYFPATKPLFCLNSLNPF